jgi:hypothetical protein
MKQLKRNVILEEYSQILVADRSCSLIVMIRVIVCILCNKSCIFRTPLVFVLFFIGLRIIRNC